MRKRPGPVPTPDRELHAAVRHLILTYGLFEGLPFTHWEEVLTSTQVERVSRKSWATIRAVHDGCRSFKEGTLVRSDEDLDAWIVRRKAALLKWKHYSSLDIMVEEVDKSINPYLLPAERKNRVGDFRKRVRQVRDALAAKSYPSAQFLPKGFRRVNQPGFEDGAEAVDQRRITDFVTHHLSDLTTPEDFLQSVPSKAARQQIRARGPEIFRVLVERMRGDAPLEAAAACRLLMVYGHGTQY